MATDEHKPRKADIKQASTFIAVTSSVALVACFWVATVNKVEVPIFLYAIFGGGILGTTNVLKFIKAIFRVGNNEE